MSTLILDGRTIRDHYPGIGRYAYNLAGALADAFPEHRFRLVLDPHARNSRFNLDWLIRRRNIEPAMVSAPLLSRQEQWLGRSGWLMARAEMWHSPYYALPLMLPIPAVVTLADMTPLVIPGEMPNPSKRLLYRWLNLAAGRRAQGILTFSEASRRDLGQLLNLPTSKTHVVPLAADASFRPSTSAQVENMRMALNLPPVYALYVGSNKPHKNLLRLVEAWAAVRTEAVLVIAGVWDARYPQPLQLSAQLGQTERILFRRNIAEPLLAPLISGARAFVFPSVHEGFGLPPLEAMACGTPVICSYASSLPEVIGDAAMVFDPLNVGDMAQAIAVVLGNANLRWELHNKGLEQAALFSWERTARATMQVYHAHSSYL